MADKINQELIAEEELRHGSLYSRSLLEASLDPLVTISQEGKVTDVNQATELVTGISRERLIGSDFCEYFTEPTKAREGYQRVFAEGSVRDYPLVIRHASGHLTDVLYNASIFTTPTGRIAGVFAAARDVTERNRAQERLQRLNCTLRALSEATEVLMRATDEHAMLQAVCDVTVNVAGYRMAWVGLALHDEHKSVVPVAQAGLVDGYLDSAQITWADLERGRGPTGTAIRTGKAVVCHDMRSDLRFAPCALRLSMSKSSDYWKNSPTNMTYAITTLGARKMRYEAEERYRTLLKNSPQKICYKDQYSTYISCNENFARDLHLTVEEVAGHTDYDFFPHDLAEHYRQADRKVIESGQSEQLEEHYIQDGRTIWVNTIKTRYAMNAETSLVFWWCFGMSPNANEPMTF